MDAFELNDFIQTQIKNGQESKSPKIRKIKPVSVSHKLIPDILPAQVNQNQISFPLIKWILVSGTIILVIYLISKIPKSENYQSFFEKVRKKSSE